MKGIDLNCDVGEGVGIEAELLPLVSSANIACGGHAGDDRTMAETMRLARHHGVRIGAHPGFGDRAHFGRRELALPVAEIEALITAQLAALRRHGRFYYVKPHGGLYTLAAREAEVAMAIARAVRGFDARLGLLGLAGSELVKAGRAVGLRVAGEAFADRGYDDAGRLVSRGQSGALIEGDDAVMTQVRSLVLDGRVRSVTGAWVAHAADSICLHGDNPRAVVVARRIREALAAERVTVRAFIEEGGP